MSRFILFILISLLIIFQSCAVPATRHNITTTWKTSVRFNLLWANTIQMFGSLDIPIQVVEKDSGIIVSDWFVLHKDDASDIDCGKPSLLSIPYETQGKITIMVRNIGSSKRQVTVKGQYKQQRVYDGKSFYVPCFSKGILEKTLKRAIFGL